MLQYIRKNQVFFTVFIFLLSKQFLKEHLAVNEVDLLPVAKHFIDPDWIRNDWYLDSNLDGNYRYLFNVIFGLLSLIFPLGIVSLIGRLFYLTIFSYFLDKIGKYFQVPFWFFIPFLFLYTNNQSIGAGEWMINGLEAKSIAYACVLIAIPAFIEKRYKSMIFFLGLALSFHVLVGFYASLSMIIALTLNWKFFRKDAAMIFRSSWIGVISASFGLYAIFKFLYTPPVDFVPDPELIYVLVRVPHHLIPLKWNLIYFTSFSLIALCLFLVVYYRTRDIKLKILSSIPISSYLFMILGFVLYYTSNFAALKFYWFRFPDAIIPFFFITIFLPALIGKSAQKLHNPWKHILNGFFLIFSLILYYIFFVTIFPDRVKNKLDSQPVSWYSPDDDIVKISYWIRNNTDKEDKILIDPYISEFYLLAERPVIATVKHFPQNERYITEWYARLSDIYGYNLPMESIFNKRKEMINNYNNLPFDRLSFLAEKYNVKYYLTNKKREDLILPLSFNKGNYSLYRLD